MEKGGTRKRPPKIGTNNKKKTYRKLNEINRQKKDKEEKGNYVRENGS